MPSISNIPGPYRFFFYSFDCNEPMHIHVERDDASCKFWLEPLALASNRGFAPRELNQLRRIVAANLKVMIDAWNKHCSGA